MTGEQTQPSNGRDCPHCGESLRRGVAYCAHCSRRAIDFDYCSECDEPISSSAKYCPCCGQRVRRFRREGGDVSPSLDLVVRAGRVSSFLASGSPAGLIRPPRVRATSDGVRVTRWRWLGMKRDSFFARIDDVRSIRSEDGPFWGEVIVELAGREPGDELVVRGLRRSDARNIAFQMDAVLGRAPQRRRDGQTG